MNQGLGKTSIVQGLMVKDNTRDYLEVDLAKMVAGLQDNNELAPKIKRLFEEATVYSKEIKPVVLFIDEFHLIVKLSEAAVEALKPMLADRRN